ncbi:MAG: hypothetical protein NZM00_11365 [Anaerolinea sp.]|nr:hypothetical protein [Anaerolinea sp.]
MPETTDLHALYLRLAEDAHAVVDGLPPGTVAERFHHLMLARLDQLDPYRDEMIALFAAALHPDSPQSLLGPGAGPARAHLKQAFSRIVIDAADAPKGATAEAQSAELSAVLYGIHLLLLLFWIYDRTAGRAASRELLSIMRAGLALLRPALALPPVARVLTRLSASIDAVLGGAAADR